MHALRRRGLGAGDIVAYALPNSVDIVVWQLGLQEGGFHGIALNPALASSEVRDILEHSGATAVVVDEAHASLLADVGGSSLRLRVVVGDAAGFEPQDAFLADCPFSEPEDREYGSPISYSSGTTGTPKAISRFGGGNPSAVADWLF